MTMNKQQWEDYVIRKFGSVEEGRKAYRERAKIGGEVTKSRGHLDKIGLHTLSEERRREIASMGGKSRRKDESPKSTR